MNWAVFFLISYKCLKSKTLQLSCTAFFIIFVADKE